MGVRFVVCVCLRECFSLWAHATLRARMGASVCERDIAKTRSAVIPTSDEKPRNEGLPSLHEFVAPPRQPPDALIAIAAAQARPFEQLRLQFAGFVTRLWVEEQAALTCRT